MLRINYNANATKQCAGKSASGKIVVTILIIAGLIGLMAYFDINARELAGKIIESPAGIFVMTNFDKTKETAVSFIKTGWKIVTSEQFWSTALALVKTGWDYAGDFF